MLLTTFKKREGYEETCPKPAAFWELRSLNFYYRRILNEGCRCKNYLL